MSWATSNRSRRLPPDWSQRRAATRERAGDICEAEQHDPRCDGMGSECDHHIPGDDHSLSNLRWLNHWCHKAKTSREAAEARRNARRARTHAPHPGLLP